MKNITYDQENNYVFIHKRRLYSPGGNPKQVQNGINKEYQLSKSSFLWKMFDSLYPSILKGMPNRCPTVDQGLPNPSLPLPLPLPLEYSNKTKDIKTNKVEILVLEKLNELAGKKFKHGDVNLKPIRSRLREGFSFDDCLRVIENRVSHWKDDEKMNEYLRPITVFNRSKFEGYLNSSDCKPGSNGTGPDPTDAENDREQEIHARKEYTREDRDFLIKVFEFSESQMDYFAKH